MGQEKLNVAIYRVDVGKLDGMARNERPGTQNEGDPADGSSAHVCSPRAQPDPHTPPYTGPGGDHTPQGTSGKGYNASCLKAEIALTILAAGGQRRINSIRTAKLKDGTNTRTQGHQFLVEQTMGIRQGFSAFGKECDSCQFFSQARGT